MLILICHTEIVSKSVKIILECFGFDGGIWVLVAPVPGHCILVTLMHIPIVLEFLACLKAQKSFRNFKIQFCIEISHLG